MNMNLEAYYEDFEDFRPDDDALFAEFIEANYGVVVEEIVQLVHLAKQEAADQLPLQSLPRRDRQPSWEAGTALFLNAFFFGMYVAANPQ